MSTMATIVEVDADRRQPVGASMTVDFNPESLRLGHTTVGPESAQGVNDDVAQTTAVPRQITGYSTSLSIDLLFDTSRDGGDVRDKTLGLVALARPRSTGSGAGRMVRFSWGSFLFVGHIGNLDETIDLFSADGVPLRAAVALTMQGLAERDERPGGGLGGGGFGAGVSAGASFGAGVSAGASLGAGVSTGASFGAGVSAGASFGGGLSAAAGATGAVGTSPLTMATGGASVQAMAADAGVSWKAVASANGIDNPRLVAPGTVIDIHTNPRRR